ncbi:glucose-1-phosphate adenylyltransferase [Ketobacter sp.]|uniref:glucose-1-phosphate adenylyltransferase n=1 Tax=Ketobacter sp. TaxID=2083498 RepID=UPI000F235204|nr:glucose-1-phosphate adenylyltransferase [Ketobacter sp.]RLU01535.1 MAG: glucose-1-phosphate adenylyltransferase [Ketobacter sp.]
MLGATTPNFGTLKNTLALILAGGSGTRLQSLTRWHSKPAVPFGGKFRTIDFPLSNCINSGIRQISILTQYKSHSLNSHIQKGWSFLRPELGEFVELLPAQQRVKDSWYLGTADAVYQNLDIIDMVHPDYVLILAGDHIYKMNYALMIQQHIDSGADITVGCIEVPLAQAREFGVMAVDEQNWIQRFQEKPAHPEPVPGKPGLSLASMGIYVFPKALLNELLQDDAEQANSAHDFGKNIIPSAVKHLKVLAYPFTDSNTGNTAYWRDVGTIDSYFDANMDLLSVTPQLNLYDQTWPIWTYQEQLPPAKFVFDDENRRGMAVDSLVSGGCIISGSSVKRSLLSNNVRIHSYSTIKDAVILPNVEIGRNCRLKNVIIDRDCKIPPGTVIGYEHDQDAKQFYVSPNGIVLVSAEMLGKSLSNVA